MFVFVCVCVCVCVMSAYVDCIVWMPMKIEMSIVSSYRLGVNSGDQTDRQSLSWNNAHNVHESRVCTSCFTKRTYSVVLVPVFVCDSGISANRTHFCINTWESLAVAEAAPVAVKLTL